MVWGLLFLITIAIVSFSMLDRGPRRAAIFAVPQRRNLEKSKLVARSRTVRRVVDRVWDTEGREEHFEGRVDLGHYDPETLNNNPFVERKLGIRSMKRVTDIVMSGTLLLFTAPLLLITALAIKIDSPGPIFYRQTRLGLRGELFTIVKFRTMRVDAEANGAVWAAEKDNRVTRLGRFLRATRIDEIPQIFPIFSGKMSFVGPRPERPEFLGELESAIPHFSERMRVKPGLTGWAQVNFPYGASIEDARAKLSYDLYYIHNFSLWLDLFIVIKTIRVALFQVGSR